MAFILITGPSGAGKDWVVNELAEYDSTINHISFDLIFEHIKRVDFTKEERTHDYACIWEYKSQINFANRYEEYLAEHGFDPVCHTVVQGYQLTVPEYREPLFDEIGLIPEEAVMSGIFPSPEDLLKNRLKGKKYQRERATPEECGQSIAFWEKKFDENIPSFRWEKFKSSTDAFKDALQFLFAK